MLNSCGSGLRAQVQRIANFHVAFPETAAFMRADLTVDRREELDDAETDG